MDSRIRDLGELFFELDEPKKRLVQALYGQLALAESVEPVLLAESSGLSLDDVNGILDGWPGVFRDQSGAVVGFWGLTAKPVSPHRFIVDHRSRYAWCAWDTLFIPIILGSTAKVISRCETTGDAIELLVGPEGVLSASPATIHLSFVLPEDGFDQSVVSSFCHYVHFFRDRVAAEAWLRAHADSFVLTLDQSVEAARHAIRHAFGEEWLQRGLARSSTVG